MLFISFSFGNSHYKDMRDSFFKEFDINCSSFENSEILPKNSENFSFENLVVAIKNEDLKKVEEILKFDRNLAMQKDKNGDTPFKINQKFQNNLEIENLLYCADERVFELEFYPFLVLFDENLSDQKTAEILSSLFEKGLGANDSFFDFGRGGTTLLNAAYGFNRPKSVQVILENGAKFDEKFSLNFWFEFTRIFRDENLSLNIKKPLSNEVKNFIKTSKYESFRDAKFKELENFIRHGENIQNYKFFHTTLEHLGDEKGLEKLKNLGYKENFSN